MVSGVGDGCATSEDIVFTGWRLHAITSDAATRNRVGKKDLIEDAERRRNYEAGSPTSELDKIQLL